MPAKKKLIITAIVIISLALIITAGLFTIYFIVKPSYNSTVYGEVNDTVSITRNNDGVPVITSSSRDDLFYALGHIHAKDRLNVMEFQRAIATGSSSFFIKSDDGRILDELAIILGFTREAETLLSKLSDENIRALTSYVNGINSIKKTRHLMPAKKMEWKPADVLAVLIMKEWAESFLADSRLFFIFNETRKADLNRLFPNARYFKFYKENEKQFIYILTRIKNLTEKYIGLFNNGYCAYINSSLNSSDERNFTIFGYNSSYDIYPGWYPVNIKSGNEVITTITYSGMPFFFTYKNNSNIMTHFSVNTDSQNFVFFNTRKNDNISQYNLNGVWKDFSSVRIPIYNDDQTLHSIRWMTEKGPVLSDLISSEKRDDRILCISSSAPGPLYINILLNAPFQTDFQALKKQLAESDSALKVFTLSSGKDAYKIFAGYISASRTDNMIIQNGSQTAKSDFLKISAIRTIKTAEFSGSDITSAKELPLIAQQRITVNDMRMNKFTEFFTDKKMYNEELIKDLITDTHSGSADLFIPLFRQALEINPLTSAKLVKIYFNEWDFTSRAKLQAPAIYYLTLNNLIKETFRDELGTDTDFLNKYSYLLYGDFYNLYLKNSSQVFDNISTDNIETREMIFDKAFLGAMRTLNRKTGPLMETWKWGEFNRNCYKIPNLTSGLYAKFFRLTDTSYNGGPDSIYYTSFNQELKPVNTTSLTGYITENSFKFRTNFSYSTSILSNFYYGSNKKINLIELTDSEAVYTTIINNK